MGMMKPALLIMGALMVAACSDTEQTNPESEQQEQTAHEDVDGTLLALFKPNANWHLVEDVTADGDALRTTRGENNTIAVNGEDWADSGYLETHVNVGDSLVRMEFLLPEGSSAGLYLLGRYEVSLADSYGETELEPSDMGGLAHRWNPNQEIPEFDGVAPASNAANPAGEWQTVEVEFRAPRYDDAGAKTDNALLLSVTVNGEQVQYKTIATGFTRDPIRNWEQPSGPMMIRGDRGPIAIRNFEVRRADFGEVEVPATSGESTNRDELVDFVAQGQQLYRALGCVTCHAVQKDDTAVRLGPNLFGLFTLPPRDREVAVGDGGDRFVIQADRSYLHRSIRDASAELPVRESGERKGEVYPDDMPSYGEDMVSDNEIDAIGAYLQTLNDLPNQGPVKVLVQEGGPEQYDPLLDGMQFLVTDRVRMQRGPMRGLSGRSIHVGQPNGINYSFDPRVLGIARVWQGGFLNMSGELSGRGGSALRTGFETREIDLAGEEALFAPLNAQGELIDFSFKEAKFQDFDRIEQALYSDTDHLEKLAAVNAQFLGYERNSRDPEAAPSFNYRVGDNRLGVQTRMQADGQVQIRVQGDLETEQAFRINQDVLGNAKPSHGVIDNGVWTIPSGVSAATLDARMRVVPDPWRPESKDFDHKRQPLKIVAGEAQLPAGYQIENYLPPKDNYGREQLFEALGLAVAPDGTLVVATRTAGIWRVVDGEWHLFADGLFDVLGVEVEDEQGLSVVVSQKAELTRITDTNGDGRGDTFETLFDAHSFHSNYHTYMHGPARDEEGNYYVGINLAHADQAIYKADGEYMGSHGGLLGWAIKVTPEGEFTLWANGLRSAAGIATAPDGRIWFSDNQGEFVSTSKLFVLEESKFYGHPSGLVDLPGMNPDSPEIAWERVADTREKEVILLPQNRLANSPGHPIWDTTEGKFGPFTGQMFIGDQTRSNLLRMDTEVVNGLEQGVIIPFAEGMASGAMRPVFLPDGSLLLGQTGRGWQARGGHVASLQRLYWDGETVEPTIDTVKATADGFEVHLTHPIAETIEADALAGLFALESWTYRDAPDYGSEELGRRSEDVVSAHLSDDRKVISVALATTEVPDVHPQQVGRLYRISLAAGAGLFAQEAPDTLSAYYSLYQFASE
ncbi:family 16 glycoside hydrolase [Marinimicrobium sp. ABcell2]|uniref:family 16 glycoside hydrolase n=1 Tax=Marinimicrobium sp. ABcell2 TaxID=3069751 RepID=UPI0027B18EE1|nr:family 16 glycoside hydrolase [Marinimicrobium sp. ABcell2]MDQ2078208.1 DUF1080 domain-containing protein [Marinimicrobium sp. ABcell2]